MDAGAAASPGHLEQGTFGRKMSAHVARIVQATLDRHPDACLLLQEYYEALQVERRDSPEQIAAYLTDPQCGFWIAYVEGGLAGCVAVRPVPQAERAVECKRLYVRPPYRGLGIADALMDAAESHARRSGAAWMYLDSKDDLGDALRLYTRRGYQGCGRYNDNPQATIFLRKRLPTPPG